MLCVGSSRWNQSGTDSSGVGKVFEPRPWNPALAFVSVISLKWKSVQVNTNRNVSEMQFPFFVRPQSAPKGAAARFYTTRKHDGHLALNRAASSMKHLRTLQTPCDAWAHGIEGAPSMGTGTACSGQDSTGQKRRERGKWHCKCRGVSGYGRSGHQAQQDDEKTSVRECEAVGKRDRGRCEARTMAEAARSKTRRGIAES